MNIEELKRLAEAATPGPWYLRTNRHLNTDGTSWGWLDTQQAGGQNPPAGVNVTWSSGRRSENNADFIAAANPAAILALIQQRDELLAALKDARELVDDWGAYAPAYMQEKHDLAGDLDRLYSVIAKAEAQS